MHVCIHVHVPASFIVSCIIKSVLHIKYTMHMMYISYLLPHLFQCKELFGRGVKPKSNNQLVKVNTNIHFTVMICNYSQFLKAIIIIIIVIIIIPLIVFNSPV